MSFHHVQLQESCHIVLVSLHFVPLVHVCMLYSSLCPHACMRACAVASDGDWRAWQCLTHPSAHDPHYVGKSRTWNCMFASSTTRNQLQLRAISLQKRNHIDSMLGRQVCTQAFLGRLLECAQECCYNVVGGASEWTRWNQSVRAFCSVASDMLVCSPETKWFPCPLCLQDGCYVLGSWHEGSHSLLNR